jgi:hypothetical protein
MGNLEILHCAQLNHTAQRVQMENNGHISELVGDFKNLLGSVYGIYRS